MLFIYINTSSSSLGSIGRFTSTKDLVKFHCQFNNNHWQQAHFFVIWNTIQKWMESELEILFIYINTSSSSLGSIGRFTSTKDQVKFHCQFNNNINNIWQQAHFFVIWNTIQKWMESKLEILFIYINTSSSSLGSIGRFTSTKDLVQFHCQFNNNIWQQAHFFVIWNTMQKWMESELEILFIYINTSSSSLGSIGRYTSTKDLVKFHCQFNNNIWQQAHFFIIWNTIQKWMESELEILFIYINTSSSSLGSIGRFTSTKDLVEFHCQFNNNHWQQAHFFVIWNTIQKWMESKLEMLFIYINTSSSSLGSIGRFTSTKDLVKFHCQFNNNHWQQAHFFVIWITMQKWMESKLEMLFIYINTSSSSLGSIGRFTSTKDLVKFHCQFNNNIWQQAHFFVIWNTMQKWMESELEMLFIYINTSSSSLGSIGRFTSTKDLVKFHCQFNNNIWQQAHFFVIWNTMQKWMESELDILFIYINTSSSSLGSIEIPCKNEWNLNWRSFSFTSTHHLLLWDPLADTLQPKIWSSSTANSITIFGNKLIFL